MKKLNNLRDYLTQKIVYLKNNPEKLYLFVDDGGITATLASSPSYEYHYTANLILEGFPGDQNIVFAVIVDWLRENQPELFGNPDKRASGIRFEADILNNHTANISIDLLLTERVIVNEVDGKYVVSSVSEPDNPLDSWDCL